MCFSYASLRQGGQLSKDWFQGNVGLLEQVIKGGVTLAMREVRLFGFLHLDEFMGHAKVRKETHADAASDSCAQRGRLGQQPFSRK